MISRLSTRFCIYLDFEVMIGTIAGGIGSKEVVTVKDAALQVGKYKPGVIGSYGRRNQLTVRIVVIYLLPLLLFQVGKYR